VHLETWRLWTGVDIDNRGSQAIGPLQTFSSTAFNSFLFGGETLAINLATTPNDLREFRFGGAVLDLPVGPDGSRIGLTASYSDIWPDDYRRPLRGHIETEYYALSGTVVSFRSRESSLWLTAVAALRNADETSSAGAVYQDRIRFIGLDAAYLARAAENSTTHLAVGLRYGTGLFGASERGDPLLSRADGSSEFAKVLATVTHLQKLSGQWSLLFAGTSQFASAPLLASEEFFLGGPTFGRAFLSGDLSGDSGVAGVLELRFDQPIQSPRA
jgi:hemolysin activation/secretion protein